MIDIYLLPSNSNFYHRGAAHWRSSLQPRRYPHARPSAAEDGGTLLVVLVAVACAVRREGGVVARQPAPACELRG